MEKKGGGVNGHVMTDGSNIGVNWKKEWNPDRNNKLSKQQMFLFKETNPIFQLHMEFYLNGYKVMPEPLV